MLFFKVLETSDPRAAVEPTRGGDEVAVGRFDVPFDHRCSLVCGGALWRPKGAVAVALVSAAGAVAAKGAVAVALVLQLAFAGVGLSSA